MFSYYPTSPTVELISLVPAYYGEKPNILAAVYTSTNSIVRMYYKTTWEPDFRYVTLDGFTTNNQFVKKLHYGFIPKFYAKANTSYVVYFEAENLAGFKTILRDSSGANFVIATEETFYQIPKTKMPFSLPSGIIFDQPVNFTSEFNDEILIRRTQTAKLQSIINIKIIHSFCLIR